jgi:hypothetical protein
MSLYGTGVLRCAAAVVATGYGDTDADMVNERLFTSERKDNGHLLYYLHTAYNT